MPSLTEDYNMTISSSTKKRKHNDPDEYQLRQQNSDATTNNATTLTRKVHSLPLKKRARTVDPEDHRSNPHEQHQRPELARVATHPTVPPNILNPCHICHRKPQRKSDLDSYKNCEGCGRRTCYICIRECQNWIPSQHHRDSEGHPMSYEATRNHNPSLEMKDASDYNSYQCDEESEKMPSDWLRHERGHRSIICSKCCIETGPDGETMCRACLNYFDEGKTNNH
ncbi:hypothetical protein MKZ38_002422 [Zalerion maritima]|uniref:Uncharacterized protein n=1 Tax=Zalerion maritima TaxID=339359 RepID=A0AAD5RQK5_9PEZI|nr:hypothetical protein MKZ38_002422 [Zalerion maritima]